LPGSTDRRDRLIAGIGGANVSVSLLAGIGFVVVDNSSALSGVLAESFAAGALLTMIADEMAPEAYQRSAVYAGLATVAGFALAFFLTSLE
jgi:ZIP family zinc transporter